MAAHTRMIGLVAGFAVALGAGGCLSSQAIGERTSLAEQGLLKSKPGRMKHDEFARYYDYWPEAEVYHSVWQDRYYWQDGDGGWDSGTFLPNHISLGDAEPVLIELYTGRPYTQHEHVLAMHPHLETIQDSATIVVSVPTD